jgi:hypothetical protein
MLGMSDKNDMITVAQGNDVVSRLKEGNVTQYIAYSLQLPNGATLVGHKFQYKTYEYLKTIKEEHNVQLFPHEVMIRRNKVVMLHPKYYLALSSFIEYNRLYEDRICTCGNSKRYKKSV